MSQLKLNHEEVANRIKEAIRAEKTREKPKDNMTINYFTIQNKLQELDFHVRKNNRGWDIVTEWLIISHRRILGWLSVFGKRMMRKCIRWYINPIINQQREFNASVTRSLNVTDDLLHNYASEIKNNKAMIAELTEQLEIIQRENSELRLFINHITATGNKTSELFTPTLSEK